MSKLSVHTDTIYTIGFWTLCALYIILYGPYGFEDTDTGYIFGTSWNVYNGQFPHRDFIYTRPAVPAYFHAVFLYISETYAYLLDRAFFYVQVFIYTLFGAKLLTQYFGISSKKIVYSIAILGALVSIHNYPPMAWNTIDGVFFCMLGMYFILRLKGKVWSIIIGSCLLVLGIFSKQSFYFMPIFIFLFLLLRKDWYRLKYYSIFGVLAGLAFLLFKYANNTFYQFFEQTIERAPSSALLDIGFLKYAVAIKISFWFLLGIAALLLILHKFVSKSISYLVLNICVMGFMAHTFYRSQTQGWEMIEWVFQIIFILSVWYALLKLRKDKRFLLVLLLLALSWSAGVSFGYQTPIHFSLPFVFVLYHYCFNTEEKNFRPVITNTVILLFLGTFFYGYQTLYRDSNRNELTYNMGEIFPQLTFLKSDEATYNKYSELKQLSQRYKNIAVVPASPLANYLTNTVNPIGTDWILNEEVNQEIPLLVKQLSIKNSTVFVEKRTYTQEQKKSYTIVPLIENTWKKLEETQYFIVYKAN